MGYIAMMKILGTIVGFVILFNVGRFLISISFYKRLEKFIKKDLKDDDIKYMTNEVRKYKLGKSSYNWEVIVESVRKVYDSDANQDIKDKYFEICDELGVDVKEVIEQHKGD
ncbi:MAG: hypothetical protein ACQEQE_04320 [Bacillota bacterium]